MGWGLTLVGYDPARYAEVMALATSPRAQRAVRDRLDALVPAAERDAGWVEVLCSAADLSPWSHVLFVEHAVRPPEVCFGARATLEDYARAAERSGAHEVASLLALEMYECFCDEVPRPVLLLEPELVQRLAGLAPAETEPLTPEAAALRFQEAASPPGLEGDALARHRKDAPRDAEFFDWALPILLGFCKGVASLGQGIVVSVDGLPRLRSASPARGVDAQALDLVIEDDLPLGVPAHVRAADQRRIDLRVTALDRVGPAIGVAGLLLVLVDGARFRRPSSLGWSGVLVMAAGCVVMWRRQASGAAGWLMLAVACSLLSLAVGALAFAGAQLSVLELR